MSNLGIYSATVIDNNDPFKRGRVICKIPQVLGSVRSSWCDPIYDTVYKPPPNTIVWVMFLNGDVTRPVYFSSDAVTAAKIVAGTITATEIEPGFGETLSISADQITSGIMRATVALGSTITAGDIDDSGTITGARVTMGADGVILYDDSDQVIVSLPTDLAQAAQFTGDVIARSFRATGGSSFESTNNQLTSDATFVMSAGIDSPIDPPIIANTWDQVQLDKSTSISPGEGAYVGDPSFGNMGDFSLNANQINGMVWDSTFNRWEILQEKSGGTRAWYFGADGHLIGADDWEHKFNMSMCHRNDAHPVTGILYKDGDGWGAWGNTPSGAGAINQIPSSWVESNSNTPVIGWDEQNGSYYLAQNKSGNLHIRRFHFVNTFGGNCVSDNTDTMGAGTGFSKSLCGIDRGTRQGVGGVRYTVGVSSFSTVYSIQSSVGGVQVSNENFGAAAPLLAFCYTPAGGQFASVDSTGLITLYENNLNPASTQTTWAAWSQYDSDAGGTGQHETTIGDPASITWKRRAKVKVTMPPVLDKGGSDDPDKWRLYMVQQSATPVPTDMWRQAEGGSATLSTSYTTSTLLTSGTQANTGSPPPFPMSTPGQIYAASAGFNIDGASNGSVGTGSFAVSASRPTGSGCFYIATGVVSSGTMVAGTDSNITVNFGVTFSAAPVMQVSTRFGTTGGGGIMANFSTPSTTQGFINAFRATGTAAFDIHWAAFGTLA